jgi:hypothetical protein
LREVARSTLVNCRSRGTRFRSLSI